MLKPVWKIKTRGLNLLPAVVAVGAAGPVKPLLLTRWFLTRQPKMRLRTTTIPNRKSNPNWLRPSCPTRPRKLQPLRLRRRVTTAIHGTAVIRAQAAIHAIEVATDVAANVGLVAEIDNNNLPSLICCAKDRRFWFK